MRKIIFVILQYGGADDTWECIESIEQSIDTLDYNIIVVDNNSLDNSYSEIEQRICETNRITLMKAPKNFGFANGNNIGIAYARKTFNPDYIAVINNDIKLISKNFSEIVDRKFHESRFAVLGPLILSGDGAYTTNPMDTHLFSKDEIIKEIKHSKRILSLNKYNLLDLYIKLKSFNRKDRIQQKMDLHLEEQMNMKLHGCFLVFSNLYFQKFEGFDTSTFLYMEEDILLLKVVRAGLHTLYTPELCVYHKEGATTQKVIKTRKERTKFIYSHRLKSQLIYKSMLEE